MRNIGKDQMPGNHEGATWGRDGMEKTRMFPPNRLGTIGVEFTVRFRVRVRVAARVGLELGCEGWSEG